MKLPSIIIKRNGNVVEFDENKIYAAINKARIHTEEFEEKEVTKLTKQVLKQISEENNFDNLTVERVQDLVELVLLNSKYKNTARAYIIIVRKEIKLENQIFLNLD